ncbi:lipase [Anopheles sinensis]|uniref:Lipase n=1 Tax=Anopheles sinensis TaxID=74873 RepID=A0A084VSX7_ANOSI|nr:lipase [Anopheles sinensis]
MFPCLKSDLPSLVLHNQSDLNVPNRSKERDADMKKTVTICGSLLKESGKPTPASIMSTREILRTANDLTETKRRIEDRS